MKQSNRPYSLYSNDALSLLGMLIREARIAKSMTTTDLASRAGVSRSLLQRIEKGDPRCAIGATFEVAAICGVPLFEADHRRLAEKVSWQQQKMALLPKSVRAHIAKVDDDF